MGGGGVISYRGRGLRGWQVFGDFSYFPPHFFKSDGNLPQKYLGKGAIPPPPEYVIPVLDAIFHRRDIPCAAPGSSGCSPVGQFGAVAEQNENI